MSKVAHYLDCGCAIMDDGKRHVCPSCAAPIPADFARAAQEWSSLGYVWGVVRLVHHLDTVEEQLKAVHGAQDDDTDGQVVVLPYHAYKILEHLAEAACDAVLPADRGVDK